MKKNRKNSTKSLLVCAVLASVLGSGFGLGVSRVEAADFTYSIDGATAVVWEGTYDLKLNEKSSTGTKLKIWGEGASSSNRIYGGYYDVDATDVSGKEVDFYSGTVYSLSGGRSRCGNATYNTVKFLDGTVYDIFGGYTYCDTGGNASNNTVTFSGGSAMSIYGGYTHSGIAGENTINFNGGSVTNIFGGYSIAYGEVSKNIVNINGGTVKHVWGGLSGGIVKANEVMITAGTIENDNRIYGGESIDNEATENTVTISGGTFGDNTKVYGGHSSVVLEHSSVVSKQNTVTISDGTFGANTTVYGGDSSGVSEQNTVTISGGTFGANTMVYGGHSSGVSEQNTVTISGCTFGANTTVYGGYSENGNVTGNNVTIQNITFTGLTYVRGGTAGQGTALNNILTITGCSFDNNNNFIYGGYAKTLAKGNKVCLTNVNYKYAIYGGYARYNTEGNEVTVSGGTIAGPDIIASLGGIFGGYSEDFGNNTAKDNTVTISDANVTCKIVGGYATNVINNKVIINGGTFGNIGVYGGIAVSELFEREIKENTVTITGGNFGSGAEICGGYFSPVGYPALTQPILDNKVTISGGTFGSNTKIYGVYSEKYNYNATGNIVTISGGTFGEGTVIYGSYSVDSALSEVSGNKVIVSGGDLSSAEVYGHNYTGNEYKNNALQIEDTTVIKKIGGFENIDFVLPAGADNATMLTLANAVNLNGIVVSVYLNGQTPNNITLIDKVENSGTYNVYTGNIGSTELTDDYIISLESGNLLLKIKEVLWYTVGTEEKKFVPNEAAQSISGVSGDVTIYRGAKENATVTPAIALNQYNDINVGEHKLIIDLNTSTKEMTANGNVSANFVEIKSGNTLTMASGKTLTATGGVTNGGTLNVGAGDLLSDVTNSGTVNLGAGTLASGSTIIGGTLNITDDVTANADDIAGNTNTVAEGKTLTFTGGAVAHTISGVGKVTIGDGTNEQTVSANAGNFTNEGDLTVNDDGILKLTAGSLNKAVDNSGTVELKTGSNFATDGKITGGDVTLGNDVQFTKDNLSNLTTFNADGAVFNFSANVGATPSVDQISVTGQASGTLKLGTVTVTGKDDDWHVGYTKQFSYLTDDSGHTITISNTKVVISGGYKYVFGPGYITPGVNASGVKNGYMDVFKDNGVSLKVAIEGDTVDTYALFSDYTETEDLGALGGSSGRSMTIEGNGHKFMGGNHKGVSVGESKTLTLNGMDEISGWNDYVVDNSGTLNLKDVTFSGNTKDVNNAGTMNIHGSVTMQKLTGAGTTEIHNGAKLDLDGDYSATQTFKGDGILNFKGDASVAVTQLGTSTDNLAVTIAGDKTLNLIGTGALYKTISGAGKINIGNGNTITTDAANLQVDVVNDGNLELTSTEEMNLAKDITGGGTLEFAKSVKVESDKINQNAITVDENVVMDMLGTLTATTITNKGSILISVSDIRSGITNVGSGINTNDPYRENGAVYLYSGTTEAGRTLNVKINNGKVIVVSHVISKLENLATGTTDEAGVYIWHDTDLTLKETETTQKNIEICIKGYEVLSSGYGAGTGTLITEGNYSTTMDNIQVPLDNRGTMELSAGATVTDMSKMTSIINSGTLNIGEGITLNKNISNSNSGTVDMAEGVSFDGTAKVVGGILKLGQDIVFSNANIQGLAELDVNGAIYNFNANLSGEPSVDIIDAEKVMGIGGAAGTLQFGQVLAVTGTNTLAEWAIGDSKTVPYLKENGSHNVTISGSVFVFSDNCKYTFDQATEGGSAKIGYMSITKAESDLKLWQIIRAETVEGGYNAGNVASFNLADDYTEELTGATTQTGELGELQRVSGTPRMFTTNGNNHIFAGGADGADASTYKKGVTVGNAGDVLNFNNISEIKNWNSYVVTNNGGTVNFNNVTKLDSAVINDSGTVNFDGTTEVNSTLSGNGTFNNNGELTVTNVSNLSVTELHNAGTVKIGSDTEKTLGTKINGGALGIIGKIKVEDAAKLAVSDINIANVGTLTVNGGTDLGEMRIINQGTLKLNVANNNASIIGGTVDVNADLTTKMDNLMANVINIADGKTLSVAADAREGEGYLSSIRTVNGTNGILKVTEGNLYATREINSKIVLDDNAEPSKAVKLTIGPENIKNTVKVMGNANLYLTDGNLGASTIDSTSTGMVNFAGNITVATGTSIPKATFANGSTIVLDAKTDTAPLTVTTEINIDSGAKLYVNGAEKNGTYKIVSGTPIDGSFTGWTLENIRGEDATGRNVKAKSFAVADHVYSIVFKSAIPENTDLGKLLENADGTPLMDWAEKVCDAFDTAYGDAGETYTANAINSMAAAGVLAGAQKGAATMVTQVAGNISANVGVGARGILGNRNQDAGLRGVSADVNDSASMRAEVVETGLASEVMPTEYKDKVYDKQVWASYIHSKQKIDGLKAGSLTQNSTIQLNGVTVGADLWSGKKSFGGIAVTYADGNANSSQMSNSTKNEAKYYGISMYHRQDMGKYALTTDIGYTYNKNDITQHTFGVTDEVTSKPKSDAYTVGMKLEREIYLSKACKIVPFAGARYTRLQNRDFSNSLGLKTKVDNQNLVTVPVGLSFHSHLITTEGWKLGSILEGGYEWTFGNRHSTQEFGYGGAYNSIGFDVVDRGQYFVKAALTADYENMFFELGYRYSKGKSVRDNKWNFNANFIF